MGFWAYVPGSVKMTFRSISSRLKPITATINMLMVYKFLFVHENCSVIFCDHLRFLAFESEEVLPIRGLLAQNGDVGDSKVSCKRSRSSCQ